jgi:hypothetical protein
MADQDATVLERLRKLGDGDAVQGFRYLCAAARICSVCGRDWGVERDAQCGCTDA